MGCYESPVRPDELYHYGVKGMHWGIRRYQNYDGTLKNLKAKERHSDQQAKSESGISGKKKSSKKTSEYKNPYVGKTVSKHGVTIKMTDNPPGRFAKFLAKVNKKAADNQRRSSFLDLNVNGKKIGDMELYQESPKSVNCVWLGVDDNQRGQGYATAVLKCVQKKAKELGNEKMTLEVPGNAPDARHIYESLGFKATKTLSTAEDDFYWEGLTAMECDLKKVKI